MNVITRLVWGVEVADDFDPPYGDHGLDLIRFGDEKSGDQPTILYSTEVMNVALGTGEHRAIPNDLGHVDPTCGAFHVHEDVDERFRGTCEDLGMGEVDPRWWIGSLWLE